MGSIVYDWETAMREAQRDHLAHLTSAIRHDADAALLALGEIGGAVSHVLPTGFTEVDDHGEEAIVGYTSDLAHILELGSTPHAIPNAFGRGNDFGLDGDSGRVETDQDPTRYGAEKPGVDFHPGTAEHPYLLPATLVRRRPSA